MDITTVLHTIRDVANWVLTILLVVGAATLVHVFGAEVLMILKSIGRKR